MASLVESAVSIGRNKRGHGAGRTAYASAERKFITGGARAHATSDDTLITSDAKNERVEMGRKDRSHGEKQDGTPREEENDSGGCWCC